MDNLGRYFVGIFPLGTLLCASQIALSASLISLEEVPEWSPGNALEIRRIAINDAGGGQVVVTREDTETDQVLSISSFQFAQDEFAQRYNEYAEYKDFYGIDEDMDGRIVEGNPQTINLSFFSDGQLKKSVSLAGVAAYADVSTNKFEVHTGIIELRDMILTYAEKAIPQDKTKYYIKIQPYSPNQLYWLLESHSIESIPVIFDGLDKKDAVFLQEVIQNAPIFYPLEEMHFVKLQKELILSDDIQRPTFRLSKANNTAVQIQFFTDAGIY